MPKIANRTSIAILMATYNGEKFIDLFEKEHMLSGNETLICDESKILCLGGIIGGLNSSSEKSLRKLLNSFILDSATSSLQLLQISSLVIVTTLGSSVTLKESTSLYLIPNVSLIWYGIVILPLIPRTRLTLKMYLPVFTFSPTF